MTVGINAPQVSAKYIHQPFSSAFLVASLGVFAVLVVVVTIGAAGDLRDLLKKRPDTR